MMYALVVATTIAATLGLLYIGARIGTKIERTEKAPEVPASARSGRFPGFYNIRSIEEDSETEAVVAE